MAELTALVDVLAHLGVVGRGAEAVVAVADVAGSGALRQRGAVLATAAAVRAAVRLSFVCRRRGDGRQVRHGDKRQGGGSHVETWIQTGDLSDSTSIEVYPSQDLGSG